MSLQGKARILLVCETLNTGGAERQVVSDANLLAAHGWTVTLAYWHSGSLEKTVHPQVTRVLIQGENWLKWLLNLWSLCHRNRFELIHSHLAIANLLASIVGRQLGVPVIVTEHALGLWRLEDIRFRVAVPLTYRMATRIVAVCRAVREVKIAREGANPKKTGVIHNCYDPAAVVPDCNNNAVRLEYEIPTHTIVVGFVGRLVQVKRLDLLRTIAVKMLQQYPDSMFLIVGDGSCRKELEATMSKAEMAGKVRFVGDRTDVARFYKAMDLFVLTSEQEALSIALLEAMASGLPAVVFDVGGNGEVVRDGKTGYIVPFADCRQFASRLVELAGNEALRSSMGFEAKRVAETDFSPSARLAALESLYLEMLKNHLDPGHSDVLKQ